jgi:hypothetical protein
MGIGYQRRDIEVVDYQLWGYRSLKRAYVLRGPRPALKPGEFISCIGGAFTFGCFVEKPWPSLLSDSLGIDVLNLGIAGVGPKWFELPAQAGLITLVNSSKAAIIMVMSGRSDENSLLLNPDGVEIVIDARTQSKFPANVAWNELLAKLPNAEVLELVQQTRENYVRNFRSYLQKIKVPKILFWFSQRKPSYKPGFGRFNDLSGGFPELINHEVVDSLLPYVDKYVECVTSRGKPHMLKNRFTGRDAIVEHKRQGTPSELNGLDSRMINFHYPSPEMHMDAAIALDPILSQIISSHHHSA